ncbi:MAG TPA: hypothetical protein PKD72_12275, partial [Gemmatales bacterium]|nr:hypothetical protein [Gemmatales bacterium]
WNLAGAVLLVLLVIKPHLGLVPGFFVLGLWMRQRDWKSLLIFTAALVSLTGLTLVWRPTIWLEYYQSLQSGSVPADYLTATLDCFLRQWGSKLPVSAFTWLLWLTSVAGACWLGYQVGDAARVHLPTWATFVLVWSLATVPYAFSFDLVALLPLWIWAVGYYLSRNSKDNRIDSSLAEDIPHKNVSSDTTAERQSRLWSRRLDQASSVAAYILLAMLLLCNAWIITGKMIPWSEVAYWPVSWCILLAVMVCLGSSTESASTRERTL